MGAEQSTLTSIGPFAAGYRVIKVHADSPAHAAGLDPFFDFIVVANGAALEHDDSAPSQAAGGFMETIRGSVGRPLTLRLFSVKTMSERDVVLTPQTGWGGPGALGATIRFDPVSAPDEHAWRVLDVHPSSPAVAAGLRPYTDYLLTAVEFMFKDEFDLDYVVTRYMGVPIEFFVYNVESGLVRECAITPNAEWGGEGCLGCDIGRGILHRLPFSDTGGGRAAAAAARPGEFSPLPGAAAAGPPPSRLALDGAPGAADVQERLAQLTATQQRAVAAVVGAFVADAASMGLHWIYDSDAMQVAVRAHPVAPEFHEPPSCPYYKYPSGASSPYGDQAMVLLRSIAAAGELQPTHFETSLAEFAREYPLRTPPGRLDNATKQFAKNVAEGRRWPHCGAEDSQAISLTKVALLACRYTGAELRDKCEAATRVHQNNDDAVLYALASAALLERAILGSSPREALQGAAPLMHESARRCVSRAQQAAAQPLAELLTQLGSELFADSEHAEMMGRSAALPCAFIAPCRSLLSDSTYTNVVRENMVGGGDSCVRAMLLGAVAAAAGGLDSIPVSWRSKTEAYGEALALAVQLAEHRTEGSGVGDV